MGYDLTNAVMDIANERRYSELTSDPYDIVLIKKFFEKEKVSKKKNKKPRRNRRSKKETTEGMQLAIFAMTIFLA